MRVTAARSSSVASSWAVRSSRCSLGASCRSGWCGAWRISASRASIRWLGAARRAIAAERAACLGVYGSTVGPGRVAIGDPVFLEGRPAGTSSR
jgi:hypothetical protein